MVFSWFFIGFGVGLLVAAAASRAIFRRHISKVRAAERRARAAERMAEIGSMTGGLAHEIKNPLSTIGLNAQLLAEAIADSNTEPELKTRLTNRVAALRRETDRLRGILTDFLEFAGQMRLELRPVDLNAVVGELADFFLPEAERYGVRVRADFGAAPGGGTITAVGDVKLIKQALLNLMLNAVQAMSAPPNTPTGAAIGPRGELMLRTEHIANDAGRAIARIHVIDTGPGITPEAAQKIFVPYFTTKSGGTGLGLPTARRIVEEHGGRLDVNSLPGHGCDFVIVLPVAGRTA